MKQTPLKRTSKKKQKVLRDEAKLQEEMMHLYQGACMLCGVFGRPLERNHTKDRTKFCMSCRECHSPNGVHKYLEVKECLKV